MYKDSKDFIICPVCSKRAEQFVHFHYVCKCGWDSLENTVDIYSGDPESSSLSNLFPHEFTFHIPGVLDDYVKCLSMESFIQSLRVKDWELQKQICSSYSGLHAWRLKFALPDWRQDGIVYWHNEAIDRHSVKYKELITQAYDCLFETNDVFRKLVLPSFKGKILIHSIGKDDPNNLYYMKAFYREVLSHLDPVSVIQDLKLHGNPVTLLCYEEPHEFCHRHLVATWLERKLGIAIPEVTIDASGKITEVSRNPKYVEQFNHILDIYDK